ncbi:pYEATS domain-containing protein [Phenylobacterium sp.]|uniref:pYEATS domain-containing protein n=1 Tax=Phenylobacterium sp. TaxID=1871053 RepID=UPI0035AF0ED0
MVVHGPPGVEIQVLDNDFRRLAGGTERVSLRAPQGLYAVRWHAFDLGREEIVRLAPSPETLHVQFPEPKASSPEATPSTGTRTTAALAKLNARRRALGAEIVVLELSDTGSASPDLSAGVRLYDDGDVAMRSDAAGLDAAQQEFGSAAEGKSGLWAMRVYPVRPGLYRLRYDAQTGEAVDQSVLALASRRTIVILRKAVAQNLVAQDGGYQSIGILGVDPRRITILSTALRGRVRPTLQAIRLARLLLDGLSEIAGVLDAHLLARVLRKRADPLLRLYAATHILARLEQVYASTDTSTPKKDIRRSRREDIHRWAPKARDLLAPLLATAPDVLACRWRLARLVGGSRPKDEITAAPMMAMAWDWLTDIEISNAVPLRDTPAIRGATRGQTFGGPWLIWLAAGAKVGAVEQEATDPAEALDGLLEHLGDLLKATGPIALRVASEFAPQIARALLKRRRIDADSDGLSDGLATLAATRTNPVTAIVLQLAIQRAISALEALATTSQATPQIRRSAFAPPALSLPIVQFDDPHKNRFGGRARVDGFELKASFDASDDPDWVQIKLVVEADQVKTITSTDRVRFYLHDTFDPDVYERRFRDHCARLTIHAFGGFTVGAWLPSRGIQLELDLAKLTDAPDAIRLW